jgi:hypothetical protein
VILLLAYLEPFEFGGEHNLMVVLLNPKDIKFNKYGNLPRHKILSSSKQFQTIYGDWCVIHSIIKPISTSEERAKRCRTHAPRQD